MHCAKNGYSVVIFLLFRKYQNIVFKLQIQFNIVVSEKFDNKGSTKITVEI